MGISLKPQQLNRYRQIAWLFMKYGRSDLVKETGLEETLTAEQRARPPEKPGNIRLRYPERKSPAAP